MALERANPLPPGQRYWVDVPPEDQAVFDTWLSFYAPALDVVATTRDGESGWQWVLFDVTAPLVFWTGPGLPTIAPAGTTQETQVKQVPVVETDPSALLGNFAKQALVPVAAIAVAAIVLTRLLK